MSIMSFITKSCIQTCVYWANPREDGFGTKVYDAPVEISCRWEDKVQLVKNEIANTEFLSRAIVYVLQDVDQEGVLFLGRLTDLIPGAVTNPLSQDGAYIIKIFEKIPALQSTTEFVRKASLSEYLF
jgi:hypothetical protein